MNESDELKKTLALKQKHSCQVLYSSWITGFMQTQIL